MNLRILAEAEAEVRASAVWYEGRGVGLGDAFLEAVAKALRSIEADPLRAMRTSTTKRLDDIRGHSIATFPFIVIYEIRQDEAVVLAVAHNKRRPGYWKSRRT